MTNDRGFWSRLFGGSADAAPRAPTHSFEELQRLHAVLRDPANEVVNSSNKATLIESLRVLAELLIWGDQNDPRVFEFFLEHNMLRHFKRTLAVPAHRRGPVAVQLLQTLSILITNLRSDTSMFFLFSNNHVNDIIRLGYDLRDEEVLAHYITFLKAISFQLNPATIQFFFQVDATTGNATFPLYSEALKLFAHPEGMVRAAVRMLTINVYRVADDAMLDFVSTPPASWFFQEVAIHLTDRLTRLDRQLEALQNGHASALRDVNSEMAEVEDQLAYIGDVLQVATPRLQAEVLRRFWAAFVEGAVLPPLLHLQGSKHKGSVHPAGSPPVRPVSALYAVERIFAQLRVPEVVNPLMRVVLGIAPPPTPPAPPSTKPDSGSLHDGGDSHSIELQVRGDASAQSGQSETGEGVAESCFEDLSQVRPDPPGAAKQPSGDAAGAGGKPLPRQPLGIRVRGPATAASPSGSGASPDCRPAFLACLRGGDAAAAGVALRTLVAALTRRSIADAQAMLWTMPPEPDSESDVLAATPSFGAGTSPRLSVTSSMVSTASDAIVEDLVRGVVAANFSQGNSAQMLRQGSVDGGAPASIDRGGTTPTARPAEASGLPGTAMLDAVLAAASCKDLPGDAVASIGWLLARFMSRIEGGGGNNSAAGPPRSALATVETALRNAATDASEELLSQLQGPWADALPFLVHHEWARLHRIAAQGALTCSASELLAFVTPAGMTPAVPPRPLDASASTAVSALAVVSRAVAFKHAVGLFSSSSSSTSTSTSTAASPPLSSYDPREAVIAEYAPLSLGQLRCHPCRVSFRRGEETSVLLTVLAPTCAPAGADSDTAKAAFGTPPFAVLAEATPNTLSAGRVLSSAPLLATAPQVHAQHKKWLCCQVRPTVAMLAEALKAAKAQGVPFGLSSKAHQLGDGVWVLAFDSGDAAADAAAALEQAALKAQAQLADALAPLHDDAASS